MDRKSYLTNYSTDLLFTVIGENEKELLLLQIKLLDTKNRLLLERINQIKLTIDIATNTIIEKYVNSNIKLHEIIHLLKSTTNTNKINIYTKLLTIKMIEMDELVALDSLKEVVKMLDIEQLTAIICAKRESIYGRIALEEYHNKCLEVDSEVYKELILKIKQDRKEC